MCNIRPLTLRWFNISIVVFILLVYGFFYSKVYYNSFGIDVQDFFLIEDYLRANIDNIFKLFIPFLLTALIGFLRGYYGKENKKKTRSN
ncbi:MAG: hypothetical protein ACTSQG_09485 [Promethearchaeota archaeon]